MDSIVLESVLTFPECGFAKQESMPTDACQFVYEHATVRPCCAPIGVTTAYSVRLVRGSVRQFAPTLL
jgi:hypothetical protein